MVHVPGVVPPCGMLSGEGHSNFRIRDQRGGQTEILSQNITYAYMRISVLTSVHI